MKQDTDNFNAVIELIKALPAEYKSELTAIFTNRIPEDALEAIRYNHYAAQEEEREGALHFYSLVNELKNTL